MEFRKLTKRFPKLKQLEVGFPNGYLHAFFKGEAKKLFSRVSGWLGKSVLREAQKRFFLL
ncbi:hypothetical protein BCY86_03745 [Pajaroellobacter abortibovis]|uniref:Uncharacterized protein n=1 Tax=Pajaroellobacter abortibovis TaxID=1882918 RepID=A0A1L6MWT7_9BACT|nr:hypothetical protein BCY86_03745 [Pajaroellobacter abortibovis]